MGFKHGTHIGSCYTCHFSDVQPHGRGGTYHTCTRTAPSVRPEIIAQPESGICGLWRMRFAAASLRGVQPDPLDVEHHVLQPVGEV